MVASIKIELYDCKDNLDIEEVATALKMFLLTNEETEDAKGKIVVKIPDAEYRVELNEHIINCKQNPLTSEELKALLGKSVEDLELESKE